MWKHRILVYVLFSQKSALCSRLQSNRIILCLCSHNISKYVNNDSIHMLLHWWTVRSFRLMIRARTTYIPSWEYGKPNMQTNFWKQTTHFFKCLHSICLLWRLKCNNLMSLFLLLALYLLLQSEGHLSDSRHSCHRGSTVRSFNNKVKVFPKNSI